MAICKSNFVVLGDDAGPKSLAVFKTELGWFGVLHRDEVVCRIKFGFASRSAATGFFEAARDSVSESKQTEDAAHQPSGSMRSATFKRNPDFNFDRVSNATSDWQDELVEYAAGNKVSFAKVPIDITGLTEFQTCVLKKCRSIPYGKILTYGKLAEKSGSPGAARAVGTTMKSNRVPIIVPCHRVVGASGLGGFSAAHGVSTKERLLLIEGALKKPQQMLPGLDVSN